MYGPVAQFGLERLSYMTIRRLVWFSARLAGGPGFKVNLFQKRFNPKGADSRNLISVCTG